MIVKHTNSFAVTGASLFASTRRGGVFPSVNNGDSWLQFNGGLKNPDVHSLALAGANLFAGTFGSGVWRRPLSELSVHPNLPHAKNGFGKIHLGKSVEVQLKSKFLVRLTLYDTKGIKLATLMDGLLDAGHHDIPLKEFEKPLPKGLYFLRLQTEGLESVRRMILY